MAARDRRDVPTETRETVVVDRDGGGPGAVVALILGLLVVGLLVWWAVGAFNTTEEATPDTTAPTQIDADIDANVDGNDGAGDTEADVDGEGTTDDGATTDQDGTEETQ